MGDYPDQELREEFRVCQHFLADSEFVRGRQHAFIFALTNIVPSFLKDKQQQVLENLQCAAKLFMALGFFVRIVEERQYRFLMRTRII